MRPLEANFQSREEPKVTQSEIRRVRWFGDDRNAFLGEELLHNKRCVARCVIVMQKPLSLQLVAPLPLNYIALLLQNSHVEMTNNTLFRRYELLRHQTADIKEFWELFDCSSYYILLDKLCACLYVTSGTRPRVAVALSGDWLNDIVTLRSSTSLSLPARITRSPPFFCPAK
jgi:hypothetical protein